MIERSISPRCSGIAFTFRRYQDESHRDEVREICAKVYNSQDYVPHLLPMYVSSTQCETSVLEGPTGVVAFVAVRSRHALLNHNNHFHRDFSIEALRVREDLRGIGLGTTILLEATNAVRRAHSEPFRLRFLSTTIPENKAMVRIFQKARWTPVSHMVVWPKKKAISSVASAGRSMLEALNLIQRASTEAVAMASKWRRITESDSISTLVAQLGRNPAEFLRPEYFGAEGVHGTSYFLTTELPKREDRSVWRLDSNEHLVGLLFVRPRVLDPSTREPPNTIAACVNSLHVAESAVLFAGNLLTQESRFHVLFDDGITAEKMEGSPLFASVEGAPFTVYEQRH